MTAISLRKGEALIESDAEKALFSKINWRIQFNIRNLGDGNKVIPLTIQPTTDGKNYTVAAWRIAPAQTWEITNTFKF